MTAEFVAGCTCGPNGTADECAAEVAAGGWCPNRTRLCVHCATGVRPDGRESWIHTHGLYRCQSSAVAYGHLAHPAGVPCRADGPNPCLGANATGETP